MKHKLDIDARNQSRKSQGNKHASRSTNRFYWPMTGPLRSQVLANYWPLTNPLRSQVLAHYGAKYWLITGLYKPFPSPSLIH